MSLYLLAKKAKLRDRARVFNAKHPFSLARTNTGSLKSPCVTNVESKPIIQSSYGIRNRMLTTTKCGCNVYKKMPDNTTRQYLEEKKGDHIYTAEKNSSVNKATLNTNCLTSTNATNSSSGQNGKSLNSSINRLKKCIVTKESPVARTAGQQIERVKARIATCAAANPKPTVTSRCRTTG